jgi:hypothetical protein
LGQSLHCSGLIEAFAVYLRSIRLQGGQLELCEQGNHCIALRDIVLFIMVSFGRISTVNGREAQIHGARNKLECLLGFTHAWRLRETGLVKMVGWHLGVRLQHVAQHGQLVLEAVGPSDATDRLAQLGLETA